MSLIELVVALGVLAVLASLAIPAFASMARQYRLDTLTEEFLASVQLARVEAVRSGQDIVIRRHTDCDAALASTADWDCGWRVFVDTNANRLQDAGEADLQSIALPTGIRFRKEGLGSPQYLRIDRFGSTSPTGQRFAVFTADKTDSERRLVCFSNGTRLRTVRNATTCTDT